MRQDSLCIYSFVFSFVGSAVHWVFHIHGVFVFVLVVLILGFLAAEACELSL